MKAAQGDGLVWHDVQRWGVEGKGWDSGQTEKYFDRLPARAKGEVRAAVWSLSRHSAGMSVRFSTDADQIWVDYKLTSSKLALPHAAPGSAALTSGRNPAGQWRWVAVNRPATQTIKSKLIKPLAGQTGLHGVPAALQRR